MSFSVPWSSLFGGMLLGVAALLLLLVNGKIAGISGIVSRLFTPSAVSYTHLTLPTIA